MDGNSSWLARRLRDKLNQAVEDRGAQLSTGSARDFPEYRERVGYIRCLREMLVEIDSLEDEFNKARG